jgi:hypothetical protein
LPIFSVKDLLDLQAEQGHKPPRLSKRQHKGKRHFMQQFHQEIEVQRGLREATRNQPSPGPPDFEDDPNYGIRVYAHQNPNRTLVPKHMLEKIDSFDLKLLQDNVVSNSGTDNMKRWLKIYSGTDRRVSLTPEAADSSDNRS